MKTAHLITIGAAVFGLAYLYRNRSMASGGTGRAVLGGTAYNTSLSGPFNLGANIGYDLGAYTGNSYDLSGAGQGSGFFPQRATP